MNVSSENIGQTTNGQIQHGNIGCNSLPLLVSCYFYTLFDYVNQLHSNSIWWCLHFISFIAVGELFDNLVVCCCFCLFVWGFVCIFVLFVVLQFIEPTWNRNPAKEIFRWAFVGSTHLLGMGYLGDRSSKRDGRRPQLIFNTFII